MSWLYCKYVPRPNPPQPARVGLACLLWVAAKRIVIGALLPFNPSGRAYSLHHMLQSVAAVFEDDINEDAHILHGTQLSVRSAASGFASPHEALGAVTKLYGEVPKDSTLIGWVGPFSNLACQSTQEKNKK